MHAVVVRSTVHDFEKATGSLREKVIPRLEDAPGFVSGQWIRLDERTGASMVTFETAEAAEGAAEGVGKDPPEGVTIDSIEVGEVVARA